MSIKKKLNKQINIKYSLTWHDDSYICFPMNEFSKIMIKKCVIVLKNLKRQLFLCNIIIYYSFPVFLGKCVYVCVEFEVQFILNVLKYIC